MAISAWPFAAADTTEDQFARLSTQWATDGVVEHGDLNVTAGTGMQVQVAAGSAIVGGVMVRSTATEARSIGAAAGSTRIDRVVARRDFSADEGTIVVKAGTPGSGNPPGLTQTIGGTWEVSLALVTVSPGTVNITNGMIADERPKTGVVVRAGTVDQRPRGERVGELYFMTDAGDGGAGRLAVWNGSGWSPIRTPWSHVEDKPSTFAPSAHTHAASDVTSGEFHRNRIPQILRGTLFQGNTEVAGGTLTALNIAGANVQAANNITAEGTITAGGTISTDGNVGAGGTVTVGVNVQLVSPSTTSDSGAPSWRVTGPAGLYRISRFTSSKRWKTHIKPLKGALDLVLALRPVTFRSKHTADKGKTLTGLIAEEVHEVIPQVVTLDDEGLPESISLDGLVPYLIAAVQAQQATIDAQQGQIDALTERLDALEKRAAS